MLTGETTRVAQEFALFYLCIKYVSASKQCSV